MLPHQIFLDANWFQLIMFGACSATPTSKARPAIHMVIQKRWLKMIRFSFLDLFFLQFLNSTFLQKYMYLQSETDRQALVKYIIGVVELAAFYH